MKRFIRFTDIGQFRTINRDVRHTAQYLGMDEDDQPIMDRNATMPTITFTGTVKLHGTNAGIAQDSEREMWFQSRKNIITPEKDNAGFAFWANGNKDIWSSTFATLRDLYSLDDKVITIFGEWCGGNIQSGVAISGLEKMFVVFAVKVSEDKVDGESYYLPNDNWFFIDNIPARQIYSINAYEKYSIDIDFNQPAMSQNKLIEITEEVEKECPVGKAFGRTEDDNNVGEGVVWVAWHEGNRYIFKVKGDKHSSSKVKKLAEVDTEKLASIYEFVEYAVTENRLNQAIEQVFTTNSESPDIKKTGDFLRWIVNDVMKEESDTLRDNGLEPKDVNRDISIKARKWYMDFLDGQAGL